MENDFSDSELFQEASDHSEIRRTDFQRQMESQAQLDAEQAISNGNIWDNFFNTLIGGKNERGL